MSDHELVKRCIKEERKAQHLLYERYSARVFGICKRYMKDRERAQEQTMNSFLAIFLCLSDFQATGSLEGWIRKITVNQCLSELRKKHNFSIEIEWSKIEEPLIESIDYFEDDIEKILQVLPDGARVVFNLYVMEGYKHREIAKMLQISEGSSKSQLHFAKNKLREQFAQFNPLKILSHE